jgi:hypothetical protein
MCVHLPQAISQSHVEANFQGKHGVGGKLNYLEFLRRVCPRSLLSGIELVHLRFGAYDVCGHGHCQVCSRLAAGCCVQVSD